jgi:methyl-accepting chemotaxis protein
MGAAISSVQGMIDVFNNPDATAWDYFSAVLSGLVGILPLAGTAMQIFGKQTAEAGVIATTGWAALLPMLGAIAAIGTIIAGAVLAFKHLQNQYNAHAISAKKATENTERLADALEEAKRKSDELYDSINKYDNLQEKLNTLTEGTKSWTEALEESNAQVMQMLDTFPELSKYLRYDGEKLVFDP